MCDDELVVQALWCVPSPVVRVVKKIVGLFFSNEKSYLVSILPKLRVPLFYDREICFLPSRGRRSVIFLNSPKQSLKQKETAAYKF
jgi:hypothetical protein